MKKLMLSIAVVLCVPLGAAAQDANANRSRWAEQARRITIVRDTWGVPHVYGPTDADVVFGVIYAQAEDDFNRVETNYLISLGRLAEAEGERAIYNDLRYRLINDPDDLKAKYSSAAPWLKTLLDAWADGLNFYLATHPAVKPRVITHFEPWMPLSFSDGSIGPDIERVNLTQLAAFYPGAPAPSTGGGADEYVEPTGSNGIAIAPAVEKNHHALLYINPHTSFFFREEAQMVSGEGLNAYGAITWGQFFVYQGFNDRAGWMHTSSGVDNIDEYAETIVKKGDAVYYKYGAEEKPMTTRSVAVSYKTPGGMAQKTFTLYSTQHGPVVREADGKWISVRLMQDPVKAITQSFTRTKARSYKAFLDTMQLHTNSSNNTIYADADGNIAYFHSNFIPKRDPTFDWTKPVDGSNPATDWHGVLSVDETPHLLNPPNGWLYNSNNWPWSAAGPENSPKRSDYPAYVDRATEESPRGEHALRVLPARTDYTIDSLIAAGYDSYLPWFADHLPALFTAWDAEPAGSPLKTRLSDQIEALRQWDDRWSAASIPTSLAVYWGEAIGSRINRASPRDLLNALAQASDRLTQDFGTWRTGWGDINRFQRIDDAITPHADDSKPSIPVGFTSSRWGSLASFGARRYPNTRKMYGYSGNSFVAAVEFGETVRARAVTAGGLSGDPASPHFNDQASRYASGDLREVYFYRSDVDAHAERTYHPGEAAPKPPPHSQRPISTNSQRPTGGIG
ncbi:MAG TPA: penicillin acylase family protein [Vicinamibacterales bacterium]|nr:penicillin acylase family protein [Vicinamibacterales bacterium]